MVKKSKNLFALYLKHFKIYKYCFLKGIECDFDELIWWYDIPYGNNDQSFIKLSKNYTDLILIRNR